MGAWKPYLKEVEAPLGEAQEKSVRWELKR